MVSGARAKLIQSFVDDDNDNEYTKKKLNRSEWERKNKHTHITKLDIMRGKMQYSECLNDCGKLEKIFMAQPWGGFIQKSHIFWQSQWHELKT